MFKPKGPERGNPILPSNPLEDRHSKPAAETGQPRSILVHESELKKLRANGGKGTLKKYLRGQTLVAGETVVLTAEYETVQAKVTGLPKGLAAGKNKATEIEIELAPSAEK